MRIDLLRFLTSSTGRQIVARAEELGNDPMVALPRLRRAFGADYAAAAWELVQLRKRAGRKFSRADKMWFDREGLEQSSGEVIARYRAQRFKGYGRVADLCCGIGGDSIALGEVGPVISVDRDPARTMMTQRNAEVYRVSGTVRPVCADITTFVPNADAIFMDPSRRKDGHRIHSLNDYVPSISILDALRTRTPDIAVKISPAVAYAEIPPGCEIEFLSDGGECKEAVLWFGRFRSAGRRATVLPVEDELTDQPVAPIEVAPPGKILYEPDRAVIRAHLVEQLAHRLEAWKLDPEVAYLSADRHRETPLASAFEIQAAIPFQLKRLRRWLRDQDIGTLEIKKRRFPLRPDDMRSLLDLQGKKTATLVLTRIGEKPWAIICRRVKRDAATVKRETASSGEFEPKASP